MINHDKVMEVVKGLQHYLPLDIYIGGSYGLQLALPKFKIEETSDVDLFMVGPQVSNEALTFTFRKVFRDALKMVAISTNTLLPLPKHPEVAKIVNDELILDLENDVVYEKGMKFPGQWRHRKYTTPGLVEKLTVDLIFLDAQFIDIVTSMASDLSKAFVKYNPYTNSLELQAESSIYLERLKKGLCTINKDVSTLSHYNKISNKCKLYGLTLIERNYIDREII